MESRCAFYGLHTQPPESVNLSMLIIGILHGLLLPFATVFVGSINISKKYNVVTLLFNKTANVFYIILIYINFLFNLIYNFQLE